MDQSGACLAVALIEELTLARAPVGIMGEAKVKDEAEEAQQVETHGDELPEASRVSKGSVRSSFEARTRLQSRAVMANAARSANSLCAGDRTEVIV